MRTYLAGPMRGFPEYNFPAFDDARDRAKAAGLDPVSPADLDRARGFNEKTDSFGPEQLRVAVVRDVTALAACDAIALLPGWEKSSGANAELAVARWLGLKVLDARTFTPMDESILDEAKRITRGDRNDDYGHPLDEHDNIAKGWEVIFGAPVTAEQVAMSMVWLKIVRGLHKMKRDNAVDMAGYADCMWRIVEERGRRERLKSADKFKVYLKASEMVGDENRTITNQVETIASPGRSVVGVQE